MQLRQSKPLRTLYHHYRGVGNINPDLDYRCRDKNVGFAANKKVHIESLVLRGLPAVYHRRDIVGLLKVFRDVHIALLQVLIVHLL